MAGPGDSDKRSDKTRGAPARIESEQRFATRTIPSIEIKEIRKKYEQMLVTRAGQRRGTVRLGPVPGDDDEDPPTCDFPDGRQGVDRSGVHELDMETTHGETAQPATETTPTPTPAPARASLRRLLDALAREEFSDEPPPFLPHSLGERFESMMRGGTLEIHVAPEWLERSRPAEAGHPERVEDEDFNWLEPLRAREHELPNSYALSDDEICSCMASQFEALGQLDRESLLNLGRIARLEAWIVDDFARVGELYQRIVEHTVAQKSTAFRRALAPTGILSDAEVLTALKRWKENRYPKRFWNDDDRRRLKAVRLVGAYLLKNKGETLVKLPARTVSAHALLRDLHAVIGAIKHALEVRQRLIEAHFADKPTAFSTNFLVQRGVSARPGFFWTERSYSVFDTI